MSFVKCFDDVGCETFVLMDRNGDVDTHFLRKVCKDKDGNTTVTDMELDGITAYQVTGTVYPAFDERDCETITMMDQQTDGTVVYFLRKVCKQLDGTTKTFDLQLDGQKPYAVSAKGKVYPAFDRSDCETFILTDVLDDGSEHPFLRKICKGLDGEITTTDFELDGTQTYAVVGTVVPPSSGGDCAATVNVIQLYDIAPKNGVILDEADAKKICGVPFLRHYTYDCEGKVDGTPNDTDMDGNPYKAVKAVAAVGNGIPSVKHVVWPSEGFVLHEQDNGENKNFWLRVKHPRTGDVGSIKFFTNQKVGSGGCGNQDSKKLSVNAPVSGGNLNNVWTKHPSNGSKFRFEPDEVVRQMDMFRLEFLDLDTFEGIWGLTPWPDEIVDSEGSKDLLQTDKSVGAIRSSKDNVHVFAYYYEIPDVIEHFYHNTGGGTACHAPSFVGFTIEPGPCCTGCGGEEEEQQQEQEQSGSISRCAEQLTIGMMDVGNQDNMRVEFTVPPAGYDLVSAKIECLGGEAMLETGGVAQKIVVGRSVSWQAPGSGQILSPIKITVKDVPIKQHSFVTWIARSKGEGPVELCDLTPEGTPVTSIFDPKVYSTTRTLDNGVTVSVVNAASSDFTNFPLYSNPDASGKFPDVKMTFSQPVDFEMEVYLSTTYNNNPVHAAKIPEGIKVEVLDAEYVAFAASTRILRALKRFDTGAAAAMAKLTGTQVTELVFTDTGNPNQITKGFAINSLKVTAKSGGSVKFRRYTTYDVGGNVMCVRDETLDGRPYQIKGKVGICN